jgi:hypothetical protein
MKWKFGKYLPFYATIHFFDLNCCRLRGGTSKGRTGLFQVHFDVASAHWMVLQHGLLVHFLEAGYNVFHPVLVE